MEIYMESKRMKEFGRIVKRIESSDDSSVEITIAKGAPVFQDRATWLAAISDYYKSEFGLDVILANPEAVKMGGFNQ